MGSELVDRAIFDPRFDVHGSHVICIALSIAIPIGIAAVKHIPMSVVPGDIPTRWFRTRLAGVGRVDCFNIGTSTCTVMRSLFSFIAHDERVERSSWI